MKVEDAKRRYLDTKVQFILTDLRGKIRDSDYTLIPKDRLSASIFELHPFFESSEAALKSISENETIQFSCVHLSIGEIHGIYDLSMERLKDGFLFTIYDFSNHYQYSQALLQERNESIIHKQLLEAQNRAIRLEKQILDLRNEELKRQQGYKDQFLANMSHEIRTPLNSILGFANLLTKTPLNHEQLQFLNAINLSGENLLVIINDILDFSKIAAGKLNINKVEFEIKKVFQNLLNTYRIKARQKGLQLQAELDPEIPPHLIGDPIRLNQILTNLLENAFKFTESGSIQLIVRQKKTEQEQTTVEFSVSDTGIGIAKAEQQKIFDSFSQAHAQIHSQYGGTGLGLAIVKKLVELMQGQVTLRSEPGKGATFTFTAVFHISAPAREVTDKDQDPSTPSRTTRPLRVLLAEDVPVNQLLAEKVLDGFGYQVDVASDGKSVLEYLERNQYDLILMDLQMPEMDGYQATHYIRQQLPEPLNKIPIIALTAHALQGEREHCLRIGMNDYVSKPFDPDQLQEKIRRLIVC